MNELNPTSRQISRYGRKVRNRLASSKSTMEILLAYYWQDPSEMAKHDKPVEINESQRETLKRWQEVFGLLLDGKTPMQIRRHLMKKYDIGETMSHNYVNDAQVFFAEIDAVQKEPFRHIQVRKYQHMIQRIKVECGMDDNPDWEGPEDDKHPRKLSLIERNEAWAIIVELEKRIDKITGLEDKDAIDVKKLIKELEIGDVILSDDPKALNIDDYQDCEEVE